MRNDPAQRLCNVNVKILLKVRIGSQMYCTGTLSLLVKTSFFGFNFKRVHNNEMVGAEGTDPFYIHVATRSRLIDIFQIEDSSRQLCKLIELEYPDNGYTQGS